MQQSSLPLRCGSYVVRFWIEKSFLPVVLLVAILRLEALLWGLLCAASSVAPSSGLGYLAKGTKGTP
ncbi:hypothetical protein K458DRAFT_420967 [Lentithecium fluviatile CBS 122367]|uniref:Uncharacterized protein n=1 Tax=Lentithecium fluviatile CBS 122367 TaxID=1168545 RepID=A0A6G1IS27_9PLEO|nr:hypothetical protein K458DRAFT_420967 [Lentithecium fluviatile CBS 122367]